MKVRFAGRELEVTCAYDSDGWINGRVRFGGEFYGIGGGWVLSEKDAWERNQCNPIMGWKKGDLEYYKGNEASDGDDLEKLAKALEADEDELLEAINDEIGSWWEEQKEAVA